MSFLQKIIQKIPYLLQKPLLKLLYAKQGHKLQDFKSYNNCFFLYKIDGVYVPSESIGWFVNFDYYKSLVENLSGVYFKPKNGDIIVDIGAGIGEEALVFSKMVGKNGNVFCIEANPEAFEVLQDLIKLNDSDNIHAFNVAIAKENSPIKLEKNNKTYLASSLSIYGSSLARHFFTIPGIRFDSFVKENNIKKIDLLKVNIEGAEKYVIESAGDAITRIRNVAISCHDFRYHREGGNEFFRTKQVVTDYLIKNGFEVKTLNTGIDYQDDWIFGINKQYSKTS